MVSGNPPSPYVQTALAALQAQGWMSIDDAAAVTGRTVCEIAELLLCREIPVVSIQWPDQEMAREVRVVHLASLQASPRPVRLRSV